MTIRIQLLDITVMLQIVKVNSIIDHPNASVRRFFVLFTVQLRHREPSLLVYCRPTLWRRKARPIDSGERAIGIGEYKHSWNRYNENKESVIRRRMKQ